MLYSLVVWTSWLWYFVPLFQCGWMWWSRWWIWGTTPHLLSAILKTSSPIPHKAGQYTVNNFLLCLMLSILHQTTCPVMFDRSYFLSVPPLGFVYFKFLTLLCLLSDGPVQCIWSCSNRGVAFQSIIWLLWIRVTGILKCIKRYLCGGTSCDWIGFIQVFKCVKCAWYCETWGQQQCWWSFKSFGIQYYVGLGAVYCLHLQGNIPFFII